MLHRSFLPLAGLLAFVPACGGGPEVYASDDLGVAGGIVRLDLQGTATDLPAGEIEPYLAFPVAGDELPRGWGVSPAEAASLQHETRPARGGPWDGLVFERRGLLRIAGPFDTQRFNRVVVTVRTPAKVDLSVDLRTDRKIVLRSKRLRVDGAGKTVTAVIDLPGTQALPKDADDLRLQVVPQGGKPVILGVDLLRTPLANWLPSAAQGPAPVAIEGEARHALGLSSLNPLTAKASAPEGTRLCFGYALPLSVRRASESLAIHAVVRGADGREVGRKRVRVRDVDVWHEAAVDLDHEDGEQLTVDLRLEGGAEGSESLVAIASPRLERRLASPPAVLLVTSDTHRADHLGKDGKVRTPFLDRLARSGVMFEDCYAATNITNPSHASILTGLSTRDTGVVDNITALADEARTLGECFQAAGYYTVASLSAKHMNHGQSGLGQGFDQVAFPPEGSAIDSPVAIAPLERWMDEGAHRPLFAWLHIFDAHAPYEVPEDYKWLYWDKARDPYDPDLPPLEGKAEVQWDPEVRDAAYMVALYRSEVTFLDEQLRSALAHPRLSDAIIAVTSDHGEHFGSHGLYWTHKGLYPETLAVPLILSWPGGPEDVRVQSAVNQLDLGRTLLDAAGLTHVDFPGKNLLRWVEEPEAATPPRFAIGSHGHAASVSHEGWYLVLNLRSHSSPRREQHQVELYRPEDDPECANDLVEAEFEKARELRALLIEWLQDAPADQLARRSGVSDPEVIAQLAALGYAGEDGASEGEALFVSNPKRNAWDRRFDR